MITRANRPDLLNRLAALTPTTAARFGRMGPQHMVEHLAFSVRFSNGKDPQVLHVPAERARQFKQYLLGGGAFPIGFASPVLGPEPPSLIARDLNEAITQLTTELDAFEAYFRAHPDASFMNPVLGELTHAEWVRFHERHFTHHFAQFGIH